MEYLQFIILGFVAGILGGIMGVGGAVFLVPALVYLFGWQQHMAQGTTLAMLVPPIGILAAWQYYQAGHSNLKIAAILCVGFFVGGYLGGMIANHLPGEVLRKIFGGALLLISLNMIFGK